MKLKEKDTIESAEVFIFENGEPTKKNIKELLKDKKAILFGLPGAYTSVCSARHLPGYIKAHDEYKSKGVDCIICVSVNDPFVMDAWGKNHNVGDKILMVGDPFLSFTKSIGAEVDKLSLIHISEPTRRTPISYAVFCLKKLSCVGI